MKKCLKLTLIIIGIIISIILLDTLQSRIFKHSPILSWKQELADKDSWVDKGIIIDTYYCTKEKDILTVSWHFKTSKFTCPKDEIEKEKFIIGHTLENNRVIHFTFDIPYNKTYLSDALIKKDITIDKFLKDLKYIDILKDGGSKIYKYSNYKKVYGNEDFYVISCDSLDNIKDIFVAKYKESLSGVCSKHIDEINDISMSIKKGTLTKTSATVIIKDTTNKENIYGESFIVEKYEEGIWKKLDSKNDMVFNSIGYTVDKNNTLELKVKWDYFYGELSKGKYRILKDFSKPGDAIIQYVSVEFDME